MASVGVVKKEGPESISCALGAFFFKVSLFPFLDINRPWLVRSADTKEEFPRVPQVERAVHGHSPDSFASLRLLKLVS